MKKKRRKLARKKIETRKEEMKGRKQERRHIGWECRRQTRWHEHEEGYGEVTSDEEKKVETRKGVTNMNIYQEFISVSFSAISFSTRSCSVTVILLASEFSSGSASSS